MNAACSPKSKTGLPTDYSAMAYYTEAFSASKDCVAIFTIEYVIIAP